MLLAAGVVAALVIMSSQVVSPTTKVAPEAIRPSAQIEQATKPPGGQQVASDSLINSQIPSPTFCCAASVNKSRQNLPSTVGTSAGAVITPSQTTQDPDAAVEDAASVPAVVELTAASVLTAAAVVELATAAAVLLVAAAVVLLAAAAVVLLAAVVEVAATVVAPSGQQTLSYTLICPHIASSEPC